MALGFPRYVVLQSKFNSKYLCHTNDTVGPNIRVNGQEAVSHHCKFELEMAETGGGKGFFNIRSCFNNKYLTREASDTSYFVAGEDTPKEDPSEWSSTLLEAIHVEGDVKTIQLRHVYNEMLVAADDVYLSGGYQTGPETNFTVIDWESLLVLPKNVAFKGHNGMYLGASNIQGRNHLTYDQSDVADQTVAIEIFNNPDGSVRIKSKCFNMFWKLYSNWIQADSGDNSNSDKHTLFMPVKVGHDTIGLRSLGRNHFCRSWSDVYTPYGVRNGLAGDQQTIVNEARITVEETVFSREIFNVKFRLMDARIYDQNVVTMATSGATNNHSTQSETVELKLKYAQTSGSTWDHSQKLKLTGVPTKIKTGVPTIDGGQIQISTEFEGSYSWGNKEESSTDIEKFHSVVVLPNTRVKVSLLAMRGKCDVPFSYSQRDVLFNGEVVIYEFDDGLYNGTSTYDFKVDVAEETL